MIDFLTKKKNITVKKKFKYQIYFKVLLENKIQ